MCTSEFWVNFGFPLLYAGRKLGRRKNQHERFCWDNPEFGYGFNIKTLENQWHKVRGKDKSNWHLFLLGSFRRIFSGVQLNDAHNVKLIRSMDTDLKALESHGHYRFNAKKFIIWLLLASAGSPLSTTSTILYMHMHSCNIQEKRITCDKSSLKIGGTRNLYQFGLN